MKRDKKEQGFTMIEMALTLLVFSVVVMGMFSMITQISFSQEKEKQVEALNIVEQAIQNYLMLNDGEYPCPASRTAPPDDAAFGRDNCSASGVHCTGGPTSVCIGTVPTRALQIDDSYMFDTYGNRLTYAMTEGLATNPDLDGRITINHDSSGAPSTTTGVKYVVLSHGKDASGAYSKDGDINYNGTCSSAAAQGKDFENCNDNAVFTQTFLLSEANGANASEQYDDMIRWKTESQEDDSECITVPIAQCGGGDWTVEDTFWASSGPAEDIRRNTIVHRTGTGILNTYFGWTNEQYAICCSGSF